jgi:hypothetical protein
MIWYCEASEIGLAPKSNSVVELLRGNLNEPQMEQKEDSWLGDFSGPYWNDMISAIEEPARRAAAKQKAADEKRKAEYEEKNAKQKEAHERFLRKEKKLLSKRQGQKTTPSTFTLEVKSSFSRSTATSPSAKDQQQGTYDQTHAFFDDFKKQQQNTDTEGTSKTLIICSTFDTQTQDGATSRKQHPGLNPGRITWMDSSSRTS